MPAHPFVTEIAINEALDYRAVWLRVIADGRIDPHERATLDREWQDIMFWLQRCDGVLRAQNAIARVPHGDPNASPYTPGLRRYHGEHLPPEPVFDDSDEAA